MENGDQRDSFARVYKPAVGEDIIPESIRMMREETDVNIRDAVIVSRLK